jgi:hypothetical protein
VNRVDAAAVDTVTCRRCGAVPLSECRSRTGRTVKPHAARVEPVVAGWRIGYRDGNADAREITATTLDELLTPTELRATLFAAPRDGIRQLVERVELAVARQITGPRS